MIGEAEFIRTFCDEELSNIPKEWASVEFSKVIDDLTDSKRKIPSSKLQNVGSIPVVDQGQKLIAGFIDDLNLKRSFHQPVIIFGDHTRLFKYIDFDFAQGADGIRVLQPKFSLNTKFIFYYFNYLPLPNKGYSRHFKYLKQVQVPVPNPFEQERIVQKIESCFEKIDATEHNLNKVESMLEKLAISFLTKNGVWLETSPLEELTDERTERIGEQNPKCRKIGVDNELGVVDLRVSGKQNFENYKIVKKGDILYNPMRINVGSLALYNDIENAITSPDYIVFSIRPEYSKWLIYKFLKSSFGAEEISKKLKGAVRERLYYKSLKEIKFPNPHKDIHKQAERIIEEINKNFIYQKQDLLILISKLKESILLKAFEGRLVEQIPSEGTGHELLAIILAEKEKQQITVSELKTKISPAKAGSSKGKKNGKK